MAFQVYHDGGMSIRFDTLIKEFDSVWQAKQFCDDCMEKNELILPTMTVKAEVTLYYEPWGNGDLGISEENIGLRIVETKTKKTVITIGFPLSEESKQFLIDDEIRVQQEKRERDEREDVYKKTGYWTELDD